LTVVSLAALVWPLLRGVRIDGTRADYDLAVYRDQLAEIERDLGRGLIGEEEAAAAKREIRRRAIDAEVNDTITGIAGRSPVVAGLVAVLVVAMGAGVYGFLGAPTTRDQPLAERIESEKLRLAEGGDIEARIAMLRERLAEDPDNFEQWWLLARSYGFQKRYPEAAEAYRKAAALSGDRPEVLSAYGEAVTLANGNKVPREARLVFEQVLRAEPSDPRARYYLALFEAQQQRFDVAMEQWLALLADSPPDAPWVALVRKGITDMARFQGLDAATVLPPAPELAAGEATAAPQADPSAAIAELAARLESEPKDYQGWLQLARLQMQTDDEAAARGTLDRVSSLYANAPFVQQQITRTAADLGLAPTPSAGGARGPSEEQVAAAAEMSEAERGDMIAAMVSGLDARLQENPDDLEGWLMLLRSYTVLGERERASGAAGRALAAFDGAPGQQEVIRSAMVELGIEAE
jgi:cytochrome c-type biogenesis protein CcmH